VSTLEVRIWRGGAEGSFQRFEVPRHASQTVLDVVTHIQRAADATLAYRFACRVGMCGSCAMTVNGVPRWTCRTHVDKVARDGRLEIAPLRNLPVVKDLVTDMREFFDKWAQAQGNFQGSRTRNDAFQEIKPESEQRKRIALNPDYPGPAALNRAWTLVQDERDAARSLRLEAVAGDAGAHACHSHLSCTERCPKKLSPTAGIAGLKREAARAALKGEL
jgi:fumarate reductase iron-sulfur subunit